MFENVLKDLSAHEGDRNRQGFRTMLVYRFGRWRYGIGFIPLRKIASFVYKALYRRIQNRYGIELPCEAVVGNGFRIDHFGGIIISGYAVFGKNCVIRNGVTVGLRHVDDKRAPIIGDNVDIGAGAKILGPIRVGNNVLIGANAVVITDVPDNHLAVGVPAVIKPQKLNRGHDSSRSRGHDRKETVCENA